MQFSGWHPLVVHFAVSLLIVYVLLEMIGTFFNKEFFSKSAHLILLLGVLAALAAVYTGNQAFQAASKLEDQGAIIPLGAIDKHEQAANLAIWYFTILLAVRTFFVIKKKFSGYIKYIFVVFALIGSFIVYQAGDLGGKLVYKYGVGTDLKKQEIIKEKN